MDLIRPVCNNRLAFSMLASVAFNIKLLKKKDVVACISFSAAAWVSGTPKSGE